MATWKYKKDLIRQGGTKQIVVVAKQIVVVAKLATNPDDLHVVAKNRKRWLQMARRQPDQSFEHCVFSADMVISRSFETTTSI